jgi:hypothetical protein
MREFEFSIPRFAYVLMNRSNGLTRLLVLIAGDIAFAATGWTVLVAVPEQRADVYPDASGFEEVLYRANVGEEVWSCIDEETCYDDVVLASGRRVRVIFYEVIAIEGEARCSESERLSGEV